MQTEYHRWWSPNLNQDMELKVYGHYGRHLLVFHCQGGRFFEFEDFQMIAAVAGFIDSGRVKVFTVDSVDSQSCANWNAHPADRARRHEDYDRYIIHEVVPFIHKHCAHQSSQIITTGCSMGAYHAGNFYFRHPDVFNCAIVISGLFQLRMFMGDYSDDNVYFNSPLAYLPGLNDPWFLDRYRNGQIIIAAGQGAWEDAMLADAYAMQQILSQKNIPHWVDIWGSDVNHDWPLWRKMLPYFLEKINP